MARIISTAAESQSLGTDHTEKTNDDPANGHDAWATCRQPILKEPAGLSLSH